MHLANKLQFKRGLKTNLPTLSVGEPACIDTSEMFIGTTSGNLGMVSSAHVADITKHIPQVVATGVANTYTATDADAITAIVIDYASVTAS